MVLQDRIEALRQQRNAGEHLGAFRTARDMLTDPERLTDVEACEVARIGFMSAMALQRYHEAWQLAEQERQWAEAAGNPVLVAAAAYHESAAYVWLGDTHLALDRLEVFIAADTPNKPGLDKYRAPAWFNRGLAHNLRKEYTEAVAAFMICREAASARGSRTMEIQALLEAAWSELLAGRTEAAGYRLEETRIALVDHEDLALQSVYICHLAYYHQQLGEIRRAIDLAEEILTPGREGVDAHRRAESAWIAGECALTVGQLDAAEQFANLSLQQAIEAKWPPMMSKSGDLRRRVIEAKGRTA